MIDTLQQSQFLLENYLEVLGDTIEQQTSKELKDALDGYYYNAFYTIIQKGLEVVDFNIFGQNVLDMFVSFLGLSKERNMQEFDKTKDGCRLALKIYHDLNLFGSAYKENNEYSVIF